MSDQVLEAIVAFIDERGYPPSQRELAERTGLALGTVNERLAQLVESGHITREPGSPRALRINRKGDQE